MRAYGKTRRFWKQLPDPRGLLNKPGPLLLLMLGAMLAGCTSRIQDPPTAYLVSGNYEDIASCLYRQAEGSHGFGQDVHLVRLSNPPEIRVALSSASPRIGPSLSWEVELLPQSGSTVRLLVRQAGTLLTSGPFWSSYLEPILTRCAGSVPQPVT
jgi:hypothetical protein